MKILKTIGLFYAFALILIGAGAQAEAQDAEIVVQTGHISEINSVAFSPDGKTLASGGSDTIKLWDAGSGKELRTLAGHIFTVHSVAFSPDGKLLASGSLDKTVKVWNVASGKELVTLKGHASNVDSVTFSPDGKLLASASRDKTVKLWDAVSFKELNSLAGHVDYVFSVAFSPDSRVLASASRDKTIKLWDIASSKEIKTLRGHTSNVESVTFSPDGKTIASRSWDKTIKLWSIVSGSELKTIPTDSGDFVSVVFSPNGETIASGGGRTVKLWDATSGQEIKTFAGHNLPVNTVAFSPDGKTLASGGADAAVKLWDIASSREIKSLAGRVADVWGIAFSPGGDLLAVGSADNTIKLWNFASDTRIKSLVGHEAPVFSVAFSPDGKTLASGSRDNTIRLWDVASGRETKSLAGHGNFEIYTIAFSPDGKTLASGSNDKTIKLWDLDSGLESKILKGHDDYINAVAFSPDGKLLISRGMFEKAIKGWDVATGQELKTVKENDPMLPAGTYSALDVFLNEKVSSPKSPDGNFHINSIENGKLNLYDAKTGELLANLIAFGREDWAVVTPDGLFDGTPKTYQNLIWRLNGNTFDNVPVEAFYNEFYYPQLLLQIMRYNVPKPPVKKLSEIDIRQPVVKITTFDSQRLGEQFLDQSNIFLARLVKREVEIIVEITENNAAKKQVKHPMSSGAQDARLFRNGLLVRHWQGDVFDRKSGCEQVSTKPDEPRKAICRTTVAMTAGENEFSVYAFNHENVKSNDFTAIVQGADSLKRKGKLQILAVGINEYQNKNYNLNYAVPDAVEFGAELRKQQINLKNYDAPEVVQLTDREATKANILFALERFAKGDAARQPPSELSAELKKKFAPIQKTQPEDALIIYFAGHGTAYQDRFYLIPHDGFPLDAANEESRIIALQKQSVSDLELEAVLEELDAGKLLLVVDACNSGQALESEEKRHGPMNSRGLAQLAYEKGMYILTAAQSYQAALEVSRTPAGKDIKHGLLTYSLLEALTNNKADADANREVTEREWFAFAAENVQRMQLEEMRTRDAQIKNDPTKRDIGVVFLNGDNKNLPPEKRGLQTPRLFYRRESEAHPLVVARTSP